MAMKVCSKNKALIIILVLGMLSFSLTGCQAIKEVGGQVIKETFGNEYILIDDIFEQLETDVLYSLESYRVENDLEDSDEYRKIVDTYTSYFDAEKERWREDLRELESYEEATGDRYVSVAEIKENGAEMREVVSQQLEDMGIEFKTTTVDRGLLGSICHFVRDHWFISLLIFGAIASIPEKLNEWKEEAKKKVNENSNP